MPNRRASNMPCVSEVSGAAAITQSARAISRSRSSGPWIPVRERRPTRAVVMPSALRVLTIARPMGPEPTTHARVAGDPLGLAVPPHAFALQLQGPGQVLGHREDQRGHVFGDRLVEDTAGVGHPRVGGDEFGAHQVVHARARRVHPARSRALARPRVPHRGRREVPDQQHVGDRQPLGEPGPVRVQDPGPAGESPEARRGVCVKDQKNGDGHRGTVSTDFRGVAGCLTWAGTPAVTPV